MSMGLINFVVGKLIVFNPPGKSTETNRVDG
jgi:hypothetical protein